MKKTLFLYLTALSFCTPLNGAHHHHDDVNNVAPSGRFVLSRDFCDGRIAAALLGEGGSNNGRVNGTIGFSLTPCQLLKIGGEYLTQNLRYHFFSGSKKVWVDQWAIGGKYEASIERPFIKGLALDAYYSHAPSKSLGSIQFTPTQILNRRVAGSNAAGVEAGMNFAPWCGALFTVLGDYDYVNFNKQYERCSKLHGLGWTAIYRQNFFFLF